MATSLAGTRYSLEIPAGALLGSTEVSMAPVSAIGGLPYSGGLAGAVALEPSGLTFLVPAVLTVEATANPTGSQRLIGFAYAGDASSYELAPGGQTATGIRVLVTHFSGAGAALADPSELPGNDACEALEPEASLALIIATCVPAGDRDGFLAVLQRYYDDIVSPGIQTETGDAFQDAVRAYLQWRTLVESGLAEVYNAGDAETVFGQKILSTEVALSDKIPAAIADAKSRCAATSDVQWLIEVFELRALALAVFEGLSPQLGLDDATTLEGICASAMIESTTLVDPLPMGVDRSLDVDFALSVNGTPMDAVFAVTVADPDNLVQTPRGRTDAAGRYTTVVRRLIPEGANFEISGTLILPVFGVSGLALTEVPIQTDDVVFRGGNPRILTDLPATLAAGRSRTLTLYVERLALEGYIPVPGAQLTVAVTGGTVSPTQLTTDTHGYASTELTPNSGATQVTVSINASLDGTQVASTSATATIATGTVTFRSRNSNVAVFTPTEDDDCNGSGSPPESFDGEGHASISTQAQESCTVSLFEGTASTLRTAIVSLISDTGIADDRTSADLTISVSGRAFGHVVSCSDQSEVCDDWVTVRPFAQANMVFEFEIDGQMAYEFDGAHTNTFTKPGIAPFRPQFNLVRLDTGTELMNWGGAPLLRVGNLPPGRYRLFYRLFDGFDAIWSDGPLTAVWNSTVSFKLGAAPS